MDLTAFVVLGFPVYRSDFLESVTDEKETCPQGHPKNRGMPFCGRCGGKYEIRTHDVPTAALRALTESENPPTTWTEILELLCGLHKAAAFDAYDEYQDDAEWILGQTVLKVDRYSRGRAPAMSMDRLAAEQRTVERWRSKDPVFAGREIMLYLSLRI